MGRPKTIVATSDTTEEVVEEVVNELTGEKAALLELYQKLADLNIRSISDLENLIAKARNESLG